LRGAATGTALFIPLPDGLTFDPQRMLFEAQAPAAAPLALPWWLEGGACRSRRFLLSHKGNAAFLLYQKCHTLFQIQGDPWQFAQRDVPPLQMNETASMLNSSRN